MVVTGHHIANHDGREDPAIFPLAALPSVEEEGNDHPLTHLLQ